MKLLDIFSGRVKQFNNLAVPPFNKILSKIKKITKEEEAELLILALRIAENGIDIFFKPGIGVVLKDIKKYNQNDFEKLYALFMIWFLYDLQNLGLIKEINKNGGLGDIFNINKKDLSIFISNLNHKDQKELVKLWDEIVKIIYTMPNTEYNYLVFVREFSKMCNLILKSQ